MDAGDFLLREAERIERADEARRVLLEAAATAWDDARERWLSVRTEDDRDEARAVECRARAAELRARLP